MRLTFEPIDTSIICGECGKDTKYTFRVVVDETHGEFLSFISKEDEIYPIKGIIYDGENMLEYSPCEEDEYEDQEVCYKFCLCSEKLAQIVSEGIQIEYNISDLSLVPEQNF